MSASAPLWRKIPSCPEGYFWELNKGLVDGKEKVHIAIRKWVSSQFSEVVRYGTIDIEFYGYEGVVDWARTVLSGINNPSTVRV